MTAMRPAPDSGSGSAATAVGAALVAQERDARRRRLPRELMMGVGGEQRELLGRQRRPGACPRASTGPGAGGASAEPRETSSSTRRAEASTSSSVSTPARTAATISSSVRPACPASRGRAPHAERRRDRARRPSRRRRARDSPTRAAAPPSEASGSRCVHPRSRLYEHMTVQGSAARTTRSNAAR